MTSHIGPGRPREFDTDKAILDAMNVFWDRGYQGASLPDLIEGTGLSRGSLYKAFGDKRGLFFAVLDRYTSDGIAVLSNILQSSESAKTAILESLKYHARLSAGEKGRRGCLVVTVATEMANRDTEMAERIRRHFQRMQDLFAKAIDRAQAAGEVPADYDQQALARFLLSNIEGMRMLGKIGATEKEMEALVSSAMRALD